MPRGRHAPSPSGPLHLGNLRTALLCWLHARLRGSELWLRVEDADTTRCRPAFTVGLVEDLHWLGLDWDGGYGLGGPGGPFVQSQRVGAYAEALAELDGRGLVYPCSCSRKDIRAAAEAAGWRPGTTMVYPGTCAARPRAAVLAEAKERGKGPAWRLRVPDEVIVVRDGLLGEFAQDLRRDVGDFVLRRADGVFAYQLAVVLDDGQQGVDEVVRGVDLLDSTPRQHLLHRLLGTEPPATWHVPLMTDGTGRKLSKRTAAASMRSHPAAERGPAAVVGLLAASAGFVEAGAELSATELLAELDEHRWAAALRG